MSLILPPIPLMLPQIRHRRKRASTRSIRMRKQLTSTNMKSMSIRMKITQSMLTITMKVMTHINKRSTRSPLKSTIMKMILRNKKRKQQQRPIA